jgi:hypothetical protein
VSAFGKVVLGVGLLLALVAIGLSTALRAHGSYLVHKTQQTLEADWRAFAPRIKADEARWAADPLIAKVDGPDAAAFLAEHLRTVGGTWQAPLPSPLAANLTGWGEFWVDHVNDSSLAALDLRWMGQLESFGFWDVEGPDGPYRDQLWYVGVPMSVFEAIELVAKARLLEGLTSGKPVDAAKDVRALVRLLLTTEEFRTAPADLSSWEPRVGACMGLRSGALMARYYRSFVKDEFRIATCPSRWRWRGAPAECVKLGARG